MTEVEQRIHQKLSAALHPTKLELRNDSAKHAGHAGQTNAHSHLAVTIVSDAFVGLSPVRRHKLVYAALADELKHEVHALQIDARTADEGEAS